MQIELVPSLAMQSLYEKLWQGCLPKAWWGILKFLERKRGNDKCVRRQEAGLPIFCASAIKIKKAFE